MTTKNNINIEVATSKNASYQEVETMAKPDSMENLEFQKQDEAVPEYDNRAFDVHNPTDSPYVTVAKIVLEPTGGDIMPENNPHIDDIDAANISVDEYGNVQFESKSVDYLTKTVSSAGLLVNLQLSIKEIIKSNETLFRRASGETIVVTAKPGTGTWYDNPEYLKYLRIRVIESTSEKLTAILKEREFSLDPRDFASSGLRKYGREKVISVENEINKDINTYESFVNAEGQRIYDVTFNVSYFHNKRELSHLTYFVQTFLDVDQIAADYGCGSGNIQALGLDKQTGPIAAEQVIINSGVSQNSFAFYTPDNKIWVGPVHYHPAKGFMAGSIHTNKPHPALRRVVVKNNKIEDLRDSADLERAEIEFSVMENELLNLKLSSLERSVADVKRMTEYFSDLFGTRDRHGRFRAVFGLNYQKILRDKTEFGKMFMNSNLSVVEGLTNSCKISLVKILRERVEDLETLTSIGTVVHGRTPFGTNELGVITNSEPRKTIVYSSAGRGAKLKTYTRRVTSTGQAVETTEQNKTILGGLNASGLLKEVELFPTLEKDIRHFAFTDHDISKATDGLYRYGVEITIEDGTKDYLIALSKKLLSAKKSLLLYYNEASGRTNGKKNYNIKNRKYTQAFINLKNVQYPSPKDGTVRGKTEVIYHAASSERSPRHIRDHNHSLVVDANGNGRTSTVHGHYHEVGNFKIGPAVPKSKRSKLAKGSHTHASFLRAPRFLAPWAAPISTYLEILDIFSSGRHNIDLVKLHSMLFKMLSPETGNPEGILRLVKLIDNLYTKIDNVTGDPKPIGRKSSARSAPKSHRRVIRFEKMFDQIFDSNVPKHTGFDYLGMQEDRLVENGLYLVDGRAYVQRAKEETSKYEYENLGAASNELSFLGPALAEITETIRLNFLSNIWDNLPAAAEMEAKILEYNINPMRASAISNIGLTEDASALNLKMSTQTFFADLNVTIADITERSNQGNFAFYPFQLQRCLENVKTYFEDESSMIRRDMNVESVIDKGGSIPKGFAIAVAKKSNNTLNLLSAPIKNSAFNPILMNKNPFAAPTPTFSIRKFDIDAPNSHHRQLSAAEQSSLPNQIRSLFAPNNFLSTKYKEKEGTEEHAQMESVLRLNIQLLKYVEVFVGYHVKRNGSKLIKYPRWERLNYNMYNSGIGRVMLCRLTNYSSSKVDSAYRELLSLPAYNAYFFLNPTEAEAATGAGQTQNSLNQYRNEMNRRKQSNQNKMRESIKVQSVPASRIHSNMLVLEPVEEVDTPTPDETTPTPPMTGGGSAGGY